MTHATTNRVVMIKPTGFAFDPETSLSNTFQRNGPIAGAVMDLVAQEYNDIVVLLRSSGVEVLVIDPFDAKAPNAVFPNNWFSTHSDGRIVLYPMATASRRTERSMLLTDVLHSTEVVDLTLFEQQDQALEGTGSMVLDRRNKVAYACLSPRTDAEVFDEFCDIMEFTGISFHATVDGDPDGLAVYHTNVMMCVGGRFAVICDVAMHDEVERIAVLAKMEASGKTIIRITIDQMHAFAGNILELRSAADAPLIVMSSSAFHAFTPQQREELAEFGSLIHAPINTIERLGGGSVRCMLAENFIPLRS